jgi:branched-chain amino acid transport system permease protein
MQLKQMSLWALMAAVAFFGPTLLGGSQEIYSLFVVIAIFSVMSYGLDIFVSDLGEVSLGQSLFFAVGAYTAAILSTSYGFGSWVTLFASIIIACSFALVVGLITLGLREFVFSLVTYAMAVVGMTVAANWAFLGGSDGIRAIPTLDLSVGSFTITAQSDAQIWPIAFLLLLVTIYVVHRFRRSRLGISAMKCDQNARLAIISGTNPAMIRLYVFLLSAAITSIAGWLYAYQRSYVSSDLLESYFMLVTLTAVILFGRRKLLGPLAAITLILIQERFFSYGGYFNKIFLGSILIFTLGIFPSGMLMVKTASRRLSSRGLVGQEAKKGNTLA